MGNAGAVPTLSLAQRLRVAREFANFDQTQLAARTGVARGTVSALEQGHRPPSRATLNLWAMATGVSLEWIRNGESPRPDGTGAEEESRLRESNPRPSHYKRMARWGSTHDVASDVELDHAA